MSGRAEPKTSSTLIATAKCQLRPWANRASMLHWPCSVGLNKHATSVPCSALAHLERNEVALQLGQVHSGGAALPKHDELPP